MSKFTKLLITLIVILILEIIIIYRGYNLDLNQSTSASNSKSSIILVADVSTNILCVFQNGTIIKTYPISSGKNSTPSPIGTWKVIQKDYWGEGFGGHWMGFNVPWGKYGIHGTIFPDTIGMNGSHGCLRMKNADVAELFKIVPYGTTVIITGGIYGNFGQNLRSLKPGNRGSDVYEVQRILKLKGYYNSNPTGIYNDALKAAIHKFQKDNNLPISDTIGTNFYKKLEIPLPD